MIPGAAKTEDLVVPLKSGQLSVKVHYDGQGSVVGFTLPEAVEAKVTPEQRTKIISQLINNGLLPGITASGAQATAARTSTGPAPVTQVPPARPSGLVRPSLVLGQSFRKDVGFSTPPSANEVGHRLESAAGDSRAQVPVPDAQPHSEPDRKAPHISGKMDSKTIQDQIRRAMEADRRAVLAPKTTPFASLEDAMERLLPYHLLSFPDLEFSDTEGQILCLWISLAGVGPDARACDSVNPAVTKRLEVLRERYKYVLKQGSTKSLPPELNYLITRTEVDELRVEVASMRPQGNPVVQRGAGYMYARPM